VGENGKKANFRPVSEDMHRSELTIDPYYQRQKRWSR